MKSIALAIIIASMNLVPRAEIMAVSEGTRFFCAFVYFACWIGFIFCIVTSQ
jgi:hypothetical protein